MLKEGQLRSGAKQQLVKYLNNRIESAHAPIKKLVEATDSFKWSNRV
ncbi:transposase [Photorhabdus sp. UCH-936]|nr:transposase [Photorhabdus antumapuensis]